MTQWHRGRNAAFARQNPATVLGREPTQIQQIHLDAGGLQRLSSKLRESKGLRHFAGARFIAS